MKSQNKRTLKKLINALCDEMLADAVAISLYGGDRNVENDEMLIESIYKMRYNFVSRISHPEPGMKPKDYFKNLRSDLIKQAQELTDQMFT